MLAINLLLRVQHYNNTTWDDYVLGNITLTARLVGALLLWNENINCDFSC